LHLPRPNGLITLLTDFGHRDPYVGLTKGMVLRAFGKAQFVDLTHEVPAQDVDLGAWFWGAAIGRFPAGTVHLGVVDPGVGTERELLAVCAHECYWIAPDNGLASAVLEGVAPGPGGEAMSEVRNVDLAAQRLSAEAATFHGRDLLGPLAGRLAGGRYGFRALGPRAAQPVLRAPITERPPQVVHVDRYGNLITNLAAPAAERTGWTGIELGDCVAPRVATYGAGEPGALVSLVNSYGLLEVATVGGSASARFDAGPGMPVALITETSA